MLDQFSRTQLLIGKEGIDRLSASRVAVFGIGCSKTKAVSLIFPL